MEVFVSLSSIVFCLGILSIFALVTAIVQVFIVIAIFRIERKEKEFIIKKYQENKEKP